MQHLQTFLAETGLSELFYSAFTMLIMFLGYWLKNLKINHEAKKIKFSEHQLFNNLRTSIQEVKTWDLPANKLVFKETLIIKLELLYSTGITFAKKLENKNIKLVNIETEFLNWLDVSTKAYTKTWKIMQVPKNIIRFINSERQHKTDNFTRKITLIANSQLYINNYIRINVIFETLDTLLAETKSDFLKITYQKPLNGKFKNDSYKKVPISDI